MVLSWNQVPNSHAIHDIRFLSPKSMVVPLLLMIEILPDFMCQNVQTADRIVVVILVQNIYWVTQDLCHQQ